MAVLCLGAPLVGLLAAAAIPFLPFACAVLAATIIGSAWAGIGGGAIAGEYAARRRARRRRVAGDEPAALAARRLRTGSELS